MAYTSSAIPARVECAFGDAEYYRRCPWNLNNLPFLPPSVLRHVNEEVTGVNVPWLYMGMLFSSFAWHNEDHYLYSINYHHQGDGKTWYGVPGYYAPEFERAMAAAVQQRDAQHAATLHTAAAAKLDMLSAITTVVSPAQLISENIPVYRLLQEPGEFVVTFPQAYHSGFSHGWNVAEATNFALADWLPFGRRAVERYRSAVSSRTVCFSHEQLVCNLALHREDHAPEACGLIADELRRIVDAEEAGRVAAKRDGVEACVFLTNESDPRYECARCRTICYLSTLLCRCEATRVPKRLVSCLRHAKLLCACAAKNKVLCFWYKIESLRALVDLVSDRAALADDEDEVEEVA